MKIQPCNKCQRLTDSSVCRPCEWGTSDPSKPLEFTPLSPADLMAEVAKLQRLERSRRETMR